MTNTGNKITSTSAIDGTTTGGILGGFFDNANESIEVTKCSNTAAISVGSEDLSANVGGILGRGPSSSFAVQLSQCYNAGDVTITTSKNAGVGGGLSGTWTPSAGG